MNFLELCQQVNLEISGNSLKPTAVTGQSGRERNIVTWTARAHYEIESLADSWSFRLIPNNTKTLSSSTHEYSIVTDWAISNFLQFDPRLLWIHNSDIGTSDKARVEFLEYRRFRERFPAPESGSPGRPQFVTVDPLGNVLFNCIPDIATYVFTFDYVRKAEQMTENGHTPAWPAEYHIVVVWRAIKSFGRNVVSGDIYKLAVDEERIWMGKLRDACLPNVEWEMVDPIA